MPASLPRGKAVVTNPTLHQMLQIENGYTMTYEQNEDTSNQSVQLDENDQMRKSQDLEVDTLRHTIEQDS